jgi:hypothetical protein
MKISHTRHKSINAFPLTIRWTYNAVYVLANGTIFRHTARNSRVIHDENELWETKYTLEDTEEFIHWDVDWDEIESKLDEQI